MKKVLNKINNLKKKIFYYKYLYHNLNKSEISDTEYDFLIKKLEKLEKKYPQLRNIHSPTQIVGESPLPTFKKFYHKIPMLSLNHIYNYKDYLYFNNKLKTFLNKKNIDYCCEIKLDGVAVNLLYKKKLLILASTRGNGFIGENITNNIKNITAIPFFLKGKNIPKIIEIRGEIFIKKSNFFKLNKKLHITGNKTFSNLRNTASGFLRSINPKNKKELDFFGYGIGFIDGKMSDSHFSRLKCLKEWGIPIHESFKLFQKKENILNFYSDIQNKRKNFDFEIDGIVIKVNSIKLQKKLGNTNRFPRWAIAFKFPSLEKSTYIHNVKFQVGKSGIITPVAYLNPVYISGVKIKKATLHNFREIKRLNIKIGDKVIIKRAGDVIPKITSVIFSERKNKVHDIIFPKFCPFCKSEIQYLKNESIAYCTGNFKCKMQLIKFLTHLVSRNAFNIQGIGYNLIKKLVNQKIINNLIDFFSLDLNQIIQLVGLLRAKKIISSLHQSKNITLSKFIYALGIQKIGQNYSKRIASHFRTVENFLNAEKKEIEKIPGIGFISSLNIYNFIKNNQKFIKKLINKVKITFFKT